ncbi:glycosyltransferase family 8 protein [Treponema sp.]|uniref:glycosyltransferase family 8 protein n=1 Tax=Treponema sp. TaxID=166 RepID=UPI00298D9BF1|nr:glycosyltransferase family 8 protein [Treponema sp.]MCQ2241382.1 glycosyltransferase family 8 protein [Treponema sp.]
MNIVYALDNNFVEPTCVSIASLLITNKDEDFVFYLITEGLSPKSVSLLKSVVEKYSPQSQVNIVILSDEVLKKFPIRLGDHVSLATYYRLYIPSLLPETVSKVLYIDGDIICVDSIKELYDMDLDGYSLSGIHDERNNDPENFERLGYPFENGYVGAGVLLINLEYWRKNSIQEKLIDFVSEHGDLCKWHDQDALNKILHGTIKWCHIKYNILEQIFSSECKYDGSFREELNQAVKNPVFIHYSDGRKPWKYECRHPFAENYRKLYGKVFGKKCRLTHRYKGKTRVLWTIKKFLNDCGIKNYSEFSINHEFDELKLKINGKLGVNQ